jgi:hypothetical protein
MIEDITNNTDKQTEQFSAIFVQYAFPVTAVLFLFGITLNFILIIIITHNKDMRSVPNMYILNLAVSDIIILTVYFFFSLTKLFPGIWHHGDGFCVYFPFFCQMSIGLTSYSVAVYSIQRYKVTVNPLQFHVSSQPTWRVTGATICGVWIVAALIAFPLARSNYFVCGSALLRRTNYYQLLAIFHLLVSCFLPLCVIAFSYSTTARHLFESSRSISEETQNPQVNTRRNAAKILLGLTVVLLISFVPFHILNAYIFFSRNFEFSIVELKDEVRWNFNLLNIVSFQPIIFSINSCLNPIALLYTSRAFRSHFKRYLTCCCKTNSPRTDLDLTSRK